MAHSIRQIDQTTPGTSNAVSLKKGSVTTAHDEIDATALSAEIGCVGYNAVLVDVVFSGAANWTLALQGAMATGGTFKQWYEQANTGSMAAMSYQCNGSRGWVWKGVPDYIKINATEDVSGETVTVKVQPINV